MRSDDLKEVVCLHDPAITSTCPLSLYGVTRDPQFLKFREGMKPTKYFVRRIPRSIFLRTVDVGEDLQMKWLRAFIFGVERVENCESESGHPLTVTPSREIEVPGGRLLVWSDTDLDLLPSPDDIYDIGSVAYGRAFLRRGSRDYYQPPRTWPAAMERKVFQDAELTPNLAEMLTKQKPVSPASEQRLPDSEKPSEPATAASVEGPSNSESTRA